jgi:hypothetical protein
MPFQQWGAAMLIQAQTSVRYQAIDHPMAWSGASLGGKGAVTRDLGEPECAALHHLLQKTQEVPNESVTQAQFSHPVVNRLAEELRAEIQDGRGIVILSGMHPERFGADGVTRITWGIGTHLGMAAVQSVRGDRIGHVRHDADNPKDRGYLAPRELKLHSDAYETISLTCLSNAESGGESRVASALGVHNRILLERPDLLAPLYRGFPYAIAEAKGSATPVTPYPIPVFSSVGDTISCMYSRAYMRQAARHLGTDLPDDLEEALRFFETVAERETMLLRFALAPGEMLILNNFTTIHARSAFSDSAARRRHLLRLWLNVPDGRQAIQALHDRGTVYEQLYKPERRGEPV